jgi:hypothetical protein
MRIAWGKNVVRIGQMMKAYKFLVGNRERKRPLEKPRCRWENNVTIGTGLIYF